MSLALHICRAIQELHQFTADEIGIDSAARAEMERLLKNLQQLLVGISIMQVSLRLLRHDAHKAPECRACYESAPFMECNQQRRRCSLKETSAAAHVWVVPASWSCCGCIRLAQGRLSCDPPTRHAMQDLTARARDSLVSFGERLSTRLFAALLNSQVSCRRACTCQASCACITSGEMRAATEVLCSLVGQNVPLL
jgi:hypothetical protein